MPNTQRNLNGASPCRRKAHFALWHAVAVLLLIWIAWHGSRGLAFESRPQVTSQSIPHWPLGTTLEAGKNGTVVTFLHPLCPCSQATLSQLARLRAIAPPDVRFYLVFTGAKADAPSRLRSAAERLDGFQVHLDSEGKEAALFNASVSGETFAFDRDGRSIMHGGVTPARGHEGDCYAVSDLAQWLQAKTHPSSGRVKEYPTFGCRL